MAFMPMMIIIFLLFSIRAELKLQVVVYSIRFVMVSFALAACLSAPEQLQFCMDLCWKLIFKYPATLLQIFFQRAFTPGIFHQTSCPKSHTILGLEMRVKRPVGEGVKLSWCNVPESVILMYMVSSDVKLGCDFQITPSCYRVILYPCNTTLLSSPIATSTIQMTWQENV